MTILISDTPRIRYTLRVKKSRKHGRPVGHRVWKVRESIVIKPA